MSASSVGQHYRFVRASRKYLQSVVLAATKKICSTDKCGITVGARGGQMRQNWFVTLRNRVKDLQGCPLSGTHCAVQAHVFQPKLRFVSGNKGTGRRRCSTSPPAVRQGTAWTKRTLMLFAGGLEMPWLLPSPFFPALFLASPWPKKRPAQATLPEMHFSLLSGSFLLSLGSKAALVGQ